MLFSVSKCINSKIELMKKPFLFSALVLLIFSLQSFQTPSDDVQNILQQAIELEQLEQILQKDHKGAFQALKIVTNGQLPAQIDLQFAGQAVAFISSEAAAQLGEDEPYLNVSEFGIKKKRARFHFEYNGVNVRINFRNIDGEWTYRSMSMKGNGVLYKDMDWTF